MPRDYKPGTFPAALRERYDDDTSSISTPPVSLPSRSRSVSEASQSAPRPMSIYDNLPDNAFGGHVCAHDIIKIMDPGSPVRVGNDSDVYMGSLESLEVGGAGIDPAFWSVDDIVEHTQNLQQMVGSWGVGDDDENEKVPSIDSLLNEPSFTSSDNLPSYNADVSFPGYSVQRSQKMLVQKHVITQNIIAPLIGHPCIDEGDRWFDSLSGQIKHNVANGSPPLRCFLETVLSWR